jgi:hypothetical protein
MHLLDPTGQANQLGELVAIALVKTRQDVLNQLAGRHGTPVLFLGVRLERRQRSGDGFRIDADPLCSFAQR